MARSEQYHCDICGNSKAGNELWWMAWIDHFEGSRMGDNQPLINITRWQVRQAHADGVKHLCGARCVGTMLDRWMAEQYDAPAAARVPTLQLRRS